MPAIAIIEDRPDQRGTLKRHVDAGLSEGWVTVVSPPLPTLADYPGWIGEHEIAVLLMDERLREAAGQAQDIDYEGHDLVEYLRARMPTLPMFVITAYPDDEDLRRRFSQVEEIIDRTEFGRQAEAYVPRFVRAGTKFWQEHEAELAELSNLAGRIARSEATPGDVDRANAIRLKLGIAFPTDSADNRATVLEDLESSLAEYRALGANLVDALRKKRPDR